MDYLITGGIVAIIILIITLHHAFYRIKELQSVLDLMQLTILTTNRILLDKSMINEADVKKAQKYVMENTNWKDREEMKNNIMALGIDIEPEEK